MSEGVLSLLTLSARGGSCTANFSGLWADLASVPSDMNRPSVSNPGKPSESTIARWTGYVMNDILPENDFGASAVGTSAALFKASDWLRFDVRCEGRLMVDIRISRLCLSRVREGTWIVVTKLFIFGGSLSSPYL